MIPHRLALRTSVLPETPSLSKPSLRPPLTATSMISAKLGLIAALSLSALQSESLAAEEAASRANQSTTSCTGTSCNKKSRSNALVQSDNAVCADLAEGRVQRIEFNHMHALQSRAAEYGFFVNPGLAKVDINNDGHQENVINGYFTVHDYDAEMLAVTDDSRTTIPKSALNDMLAAGPGSVLADESFPFRVRLFTRAGVVYIETEIRGSGDEGEPHVLVVYVIHGDQPHRVCSFDGTLAELGDGL